MNSSTTNHDADQAFLGNMVRMPIPYLPLDQRLPVPTWWFPGFFALIIISCIVPRSLHNLRIAVFGPILLAMWLQTPNYTTGDHGLNFAVGLFATGTAFMWVEFVVLHVPERDYWRSDANKMKIGPGPDGSLWEKIRWATSLWATTRGLGWNWRVGGVPKGVPAGYPRWKFVLEQAHKCILSSLIMDYGLEVFKTTEYGRFGGWPSLFEQPTLYRTALIWTSGFESSTILTFNYHLLATITTAIGLYDPQDWPDLFGTFTQDCWSVRQLWGVTWHKILKKPLSAPGEVLVKNFKMQKGSWQAKYTRLYMGFLMSAILHHAGAYMISHQSAGMYYLFTSQAVIITLEDFVIYLGKKAGIKSSPYIKLLGMAWVAIWLSTPLVGGIAVDLLLVNGHNAIDSHPQGFSTIALFRYLNGCDTFWKVMADRLSVLAILTQALHIFQVRRWRDLAPALGHILLVGALYYASVTGNESLDLGIKVLGSGLFVAKFTRIVFNTGFSKL